MNKTKRRRGKEASQPAVQCGEYVNAPTANQNGGGSSSSSSSSSNRSSSNGVIPSSSWVFFPLQQNRRDFFLRGLVFFHGCEERKPDAVAMKSKACKKGTSRKHDVMFLVACCFFSFLSFSRSLAPASTTPLILILFYPILGLLLLLLLLLPYIHTFLMFAPS